MILATMTDKKKNYIRAKDGVHLGWDLIHFWEAIWHYIMAWLPHDSPQSTTDWSTCIAECV